MIEGTDPQLKSTYVAFGAHYDHVGYAEGEVVRTATSRGALGAPGRVTAGREDDRIWNGADDDGSGTVALMALAQAFAEGPQPKRSLLFVWHTGEELGLYGSRYFADYPTVPIDRDRGAAEHRHDRPKPRRQAERGEHGLPGRVGPHQQRAAQPEPRREQRAASAADARTTS